MTLLRRFLRTAPRTPRTQPKRRSQPTVEVLEDRLVPATLTVTNLADDGSAGTLRAEIGQAKAGDTINFQAGLAGTITLNSTKGPLAIAENLTITGPATAIAVSGGGQVADLKVTNGNVTITDLTFTGGKGASGGGIYVGGKGVLTLLGCTVAGNTATQAGGGIYVTGHQPGPTVFNLIVINSTVADNQAGSTGGGGIDINDSNVSFINCTVAGNTTTGPGGGVLQAGNQVGMSACNTIFAANTEAAGGEFGAQGDVCQASTSTSGSLEQNLVGNADGDIDFQFTGGNIYGTTKNPINPNLGPLQNNGGPTETMALLAGSPAIDKGNNANAVDQNGNPLQYDQRGSGFARVVNKTVDIGAFEYTPYPPITITPTTVPVGVAGSMYTPTTLQAAGGTGSGPYTFSATGSLDGLAVSSAGILSGTPTQTGTFAFTVTAKDSAGNSGQQNYTLTVNPAVSIGPATLPGGTAGDSYSQTLTATGGTGTGYTFTATGNLDGLTLSTAGTLSGTPAAAGSFSVTVTAKDSSGNTGSQSYTLTVVSITLGPTTLPVANATTPYAPQTVSAQNGVGPYSYTYTGSLPTGMSLSPGGTLSGVPTLTGSFSFTIIATDTQGATGSQAYSFTVEPPITMSPASPLPLAVAGAAYTQALSASGGSGTGFSFSVTNGSLPVGLNLTGGQITGTPATVGTPTTYTFTVTATDGLGGKGSQVYELTVDPRLTISPTALPAASDDKSYSQTLTPSGGSGSGYSFQATGLPAGLSLSTGGLLSGTPPTVATPAQYAVSITLTDGLGGSTQQHYVLTVEPPLDLNAAILPYAAQNGPYSYTFSAVGGSGSGYSYAVIAGTLPPGLGPLAASGQLAGAATVGSGTCPFTVQVTDSAGDTAIQTYSITVEGPLVFGPATLPVGTVNTPYNQGMPVSVNSSAGGPYALRVLGSVPGLGFDTSSNTLVGTPTQAGTFSFTLSATDGMGGTGSRTYTVLVDPALVLTPASLPVATVSATYHQVLAAGGGSGAGYTFSSSGLPSWLTLSSSGILAGTPTSQAGSPLSFAITATDSAGGSLTQMYHLAVNPAVSVGPATLPTTAQGDTYYFPLSASGGSGGGYDYTVTAGALPTGIGFSGNVLTGQDVTAPPGVYSFTVLVTDSNGAAADQNYSIIVSAPVRIVSTGPTTGTMGSTYTQTLTAQAGSGSGYVFTETGALPAGLTLTYGAGAVTLSGTPAQYGTFPIQFSVTDGMGGTASLSFSVVIAFNLGTSPNALFVDAVYQQLLHRGPDPSAADWLNLLNRGMAPSTLVLDVERTPEYLTDLVASIYQQYLGRGLDAGAASWVNQLAAGASVERVTASILASAEYLNDKGGTLAGFVTGLYVDVLGRAADAGGLSAWTNFLNGGSRYQVALAILTSTEHDMDLVAGYAWTPAGNPGTGGYYLTLLGRQGDRAGVAGWVQALQSGLSDQEVLAAFLGSKEGYLHWT